MGLTLIKNGIKKGTCHAPDIVENLDRIRGVTGTLFGTLFS